MPVANAISTDMFPPCGGALLALLRITVVNSLIDRPVGLVARPVFLFACIRLRPAEKGVAPPLAKNGNQLTYHARAAGRGK